jgi:signal transduction histidine kinase
MRFLAFITFLLSIHATCLHAQTVTIDSLKKELSLATEDTTRINLLIDIAYEQSDSVQLNTALQAYKLARNVAYQKFKGRTEAVLGYFYSHYDLDSGISLLNTAANRYLTNDMGEKAANALWFKGVAFEIANKFDSAIHSYEMAAEIAEKGNHFDEIASAYSAIGAISNTRGHNVEALEYSLKAKDAYMKAGMIKESGQVLNQIGIVYDQKGLYSEALESYLKALDIAIETNDIESEILTGNNLGVICDNMNNSEKSQQYYSDALEKAGIHGLKDSEATLMNNLSYIYLKKGDTIQALSLLKKSLQIDLSDIYPCFDSYPNEGIGVIYLAKGKLDSAEYYLKNSLETGSKCEDVVILTAANKGLGMLEAKRGNYKLAETYLNKSLEISKSSNLITEMQEATFELYKFHRSTGNTNESIKYLEKYQSLSDSIYKAKNIEKATQLAAEYEFRKQVDIMEEERRKSDLLFQTELRSKQKKNIFALIATALFALLAVSLGRSYYVIKNNNKKLKWLNEEKNTLMGMVAHDLRNPLNMIKGLMQLIADTRPKGQDDEEQHYLNLITQSTDKMRSMIDRVLDISAVENMKVNLNMERKDLAKLMLKSSENFKQIAAQKNIEIQNDFDSNVSLHSNVDPNYFDQVMDNLLSNAIKFSEMGKKIYLKLEKSGDDNIISIKDEGPGIDDQDKEKLFAKFTKLTPKPTSNEQSIGLGLSIVQKFVRAMNGEISCESQIGVGTTFSVKFKGA